MRDYARLLALLIAGLATLVFQVIAKPRPDPEIIAQQSRSFTDPAVWRNRVAPDFEITLLDGTRTQLSHHIGRKVVVLNFFATWCGPCRAEMPELQRFALAQGADTFMLLGIDVEEKHTVVEAFVANLHLTFPIGIDGSGDIAKLYGVSAFPTTVVIGADGRVKLYEVSAIANADVSLGGVVTPELAAIREGRGITAEDYRQALAAVPKATGTAAPLSGRALQLANAMTCPCGCEDKVNACSCDTAKKIRARLAAGGYDGQTDVQVIEALNKEFCVKGT